MLLKCFDLLSGSFPTSTKGCLGVLMSFQNVNCIIEIATRWQASDDATHASKIFQRISFFGCPCLLVLNSRLLQALSLQLWLLALKLSKQLLPANHHVEIAMPTNRAHTHAHSSTTKPHAHSSTLNA